MVRLGYKGTSALADGVRRQRARAVWGDSIEGHVHRRMSTVSLVNVTAAPIEAATQSASVRKVADRTGHPPSLRPGELVQGLGCRRSRRIDTDFRTADRIHRNRLIECLESRSVMKIPVVPRVVETAGKPIGVISKRCDVRIRIRAGKRGPVGRSIKEIR